MNAKTVSFLSAHDRLIPEDLLLIREDLAEHDPAMDFRFYAVNEYRKDPLVAEGARQARRDFIRGGDRFIYVDPTFRADVRHTASLMVAAPYDCYFALANKAPDGGSAPAEKSAGSSRVISTSPFMTQLLQNRLGIAAQQITECASPLVRDLENEAKRREARQNLQQYYPQAEGKKILALIKSGDRTDRIRERYKTFPLRTLLDMCGEDWYLFTNMADVVDAASALPSRYRERFGYVNAFDSQMNMPYLADVMVSSCAHLVCGFAGMGRKTLGMRYEDNQFAAYMTKTYPDHFLSDPGQLAGRLEQLLYAEPAEDEFTRAFHQDREADPYAVVREFLGVTG